MNPANTPSLLNRRRFLLASAGGVLTTLGPGGPWTLDATQATAPDTALTPGWHPTVDLLRNLPRLLELATVPGLSLAVVEGDRIWSRGFGRASLTPPTSATDDTLFEAASLGKPLFAYCVLRLSDAGVIDLSRPLWQYLAIPEADHPLTRRITAAHVLSHTTRLPNWRAQPGPLLPAGEPGGEFSYSGEAFVYLQRVVEKVTGRAFPELMETEILEPLGMKNSSYVWRPEFEPRMAAGHDEQGSRLDVYSAMGRRAAQIAAEWRKPMREWRYEDAARAVPLINPQWPVLPLYMTPNAASSLLTTGEDYARFLRRLTAAAPGQGLDLEPATRRAMVTPRVRLNSALSWGLGWGIQRDEHGEVLWHWGANNSFRNFAIADPTHGQAVVVLTNSENGPRVYERVIASITKRDHPAFLWI